MNIPIFDVKMMLTQEVFMKIIFICSCSWLSGLASQVQWIQLSICTPEATAYSVFQADTCLPAGKNNFHKWSTVVGGTGDSTTQTSFEYGIYDDSNCTDGAPTSVVVEKSCVPIIPPGNILPVYDVLYTAELLNAIPAIPKFGWIDRYYAPGENCAGSYLMGFTYVNLHTCVFDYR